MAKEIERKFLVKDIEQVKVLSRSVHEIRQAYISDRPEVTVRVRTYDSEAYVTIKGKNKGAERDEWEYRVPYDEALEMAEKLCGGFTIDKTRYKVNHGGLEWEIDEFHGRHNGLILAEVELPRNDFEITDFPEFIGQEVTGDPKYYNSVLSRS